MNSREFKKVRVTNLFMKIMLIATKKLKVRATVGPQTRCVCCCCCLFGVSGERNLLNNEARKSSKAFPETEKTKSAQRLFLKNPN